MNAKDERQKCLIGGDKNSNRFAEMWRGE